jgi:hypothetical protein
LEGEGYGEEEELVAEGDEKGEEEVVAVEDIMGGHSEEEVRRWSSKWWFECSISSL